MDATSSQKLETTSLGSFLVIPLGGHFTTLDKYGPLTSEASSHPSPDQIRPKFIEFCAFERLRLGVLVKTKETLLVFGEKVLFSLTSHFLLVASRSPSGRSFHPHTTTLVTLRFRVVLFPDVTSVSSTNESFGGHLVPVDKDL